MSIATTGSTNGFFVDQEALSTSAEELLPARTQTYRTTIKNLDSSITVYVGHSDAVSSSNGMPLRAGESISLYTTAAIYMIAASGTPTVAYTIERQN